MRLREIISSFRLVRYERESGQESFGISHLTKVIEKDYHAPRRDCELIAALRRVTSSVARDLH